MMEHFSRCRSTHSRSTGANLLKSDSCLAVTQAWKATSKCGVGCLTTAGVQGSWKEGASHRKKGLEEIGKRHMEGAKRWLRPRGDLRARFEAEEVDLLHSTSGHNMSANANPLVWLRAGADNSPAPSQTWYPSDSRRAALLTVSFGIDEALL